MKLKYQLTESVVRNFPELIKVARIPTSKIKIKDNVAVIKLTIYNNAEMNQFRYNLIDDIKSSVNKLKGIDFHGNDELIIQKGFDFSKLTKDDIGNIEDFYNTY